MTLETIAYSPWWIPVCLIAVLAVYWDWQKPATKRLVLAVSVAMLTGVGLSAATLPNPDWCAQFEPYSFIWWFYGCWAL